jgi:hypothetical protein
MLFDSSLPEIVDLSGLSDAVLGRVGAHRERRLCTQVGGDTVCRIAIAQRIAG